MLELTKEQLLAFEALRMPSLAAMMDREGADVILKEYNIVSPKYIIDYSNSSVKKRLNLFKRE